MSVEQFVAIRRNELPSAQSLDEEAARLGFSVRIDPGDLASHIGFLPVRLNGDDTGFEWSVEPASDFQDLGHDFGSRDCVVVFRTGSDEREAQCAMIVAAALLSLCRGMYFDEAGTIHITPQPLLDEVRHWMND